MRDERKVKSRFELKLDSTQVFWFFAGIAAWSLLVFLLGVVVGRAKRVDETAAVPPVLLPDASPNASPVAKIEDRLSAAQPKATEEPELPLGFYENLENPGAAAKGTARPAATRTPTPAPTPTATPTATPAPTAAAQKTPADGKYTIQVIAYNDEAQAQKAVAMLKSRGFDAYTVTAQIPGKGTIHRVRVGRYVTRDAAESAKGPLSTVDPGLKPMVVSYE